MLQIGLIGNDLRADFSKSYLQSTYKTEKQNMEKLIVFELLFKT